MKKFILFSIAWTFLSLPLLAQTDDDSIKSTINAYFDGFTKGDSASLNKAFYAGALLRNLNASTGKVQDSPLKSFISKMPSGGVKATGKLISYSYAGTSGIAAVELQFADFKYMDLLSLLKINDQWKIVCRVYSRIDLDAQLKGSAPTTETAASTVKKNSPNVKAKKNDGW